MTAPPDAAAREREERFASAERRVEEQSAELKKELRLGDLVMSQLILIIGLTWPGTAGKLGPSHVMFWLPAVLLFYVPSGIVVAHLNREMPLEGGIYQWAKLRFGEMTGFLVALNLWASLVLNLGSAASMTTVTLSYLGGPSTAWVAESKGVTIGVAVAQTLLLMMAAVRGLGVAKWITNVGSYGLLATFAAMAAFAAPRWLRGDAVVAPLAFTAPAVSLLNLNLLGKMGFGAFCGFDGAALFAGEVRGDDAARTIRRSMWVAAPLIGLAYVVGTAGVLAFTAPGDIDLVEPTVQALSRGGAALGASAVVMPVVVTITLASVVGNQSFAMNAAVRLPMVAGWDRLLPSWLSRLHPRFKTPVGSIALFGATGLAVAVFANANAGAQEAFQIAFSGNLVCWAMAYLVMFAGPLLAPRP
jgi:amino acid transporter